MSGSDQSPHFTSPRLIDQKFLASSEHEDGVLHRKCIGRTKLTSLDPFLSFVMFEMSAPAGYPFHPRRGSEIVTYMLEGAFTQEVLGGYKGTIRSRDAQWTRTGRGLIHSEMPDGEELSKGVQLSINLSSKDKTIEPNLEEVLSKDIPMVEKDGVEVRVIAGEAMGVSSPVYTRTPTMFLDFTLQPQAQHHQTIPESWNALVYVLEGEGLFGTLSSTPVVAHHVMVLSHGDGVSVWNKSSETLRFLLLGGEPLNEPVVQCGTFVMNTQAEIDQCFEDYKLCRNGFEMAMHGGHVHWVYKG